MKKEWYNVEDEFFIYGGFIKAPKRIRFIQDDLWEESKKKVAEYKQRAHLKYKNRQDLYNN